jgi:predicted short-subunit dehydrogenase-like oxidoreductase (DUF2520 family)
MDSLQTEMETIEFISIAGSGNIATHLAQAFVRAGVKVDKIYSRHLSHASTLASAAGAMAIDDISELDNTSQVLLIALPDRVIPGFAGELQQAGNFQGIVAHTCGPQPLSVLESVFEKAGVLYPLQTFNRFNKPDMRQVPFCIEGNSKEVEEILANLAGLISADVRFIDSRQRAMLHLAAVFACNFTNHMYALAADILENAGVDHDILRPLILETAQQVRELNPGFSQTGPAVRGDIPTMLFHQEMLKDFPEVKELYQQISESIVLWKTKNEH